MKGLQGERLRQAFKYLDTDQDGFILPEEFKRIILVCITDYQMFVWDANASIGNCWSQTIRCCDRPIAHTVYAEPWSAYILFRSYCFS